MTYDEVFDEICNSVLGISFDTPKQEEVAKEFFETMIHRFDVFCRKNRQYGDSFREAGAKGAFGEIHGKFARLRELVWRASEEEILANRGTIIQNSLDLGNYADILIMCVAAGNVFGDFQEDEK